MLVSNLTLILFGLLTTLSISGKQNFNKKANFHPVHVSFTNIEYVQDNKQFQILIKIFADDFDLILKKNYNVFLNLQNGKKPNDYEKTVSKYILSHFKIFIDNKDYSSTKLKFSNLELKEKAVWLHYTLKYKGNSTRFELWNSMMTDLYYDQTNLLIFNYKSYQKAIRFTNDKTKEVLSVKTD